MNDDITFAGWQGYYRDPHGKRATLAIDIRGTNIVLLPTPTEPLHFTPLEAGLLLDALAAAIRAVGSVP